MSLEGAGLAMTGDSYCLLRKSIPAFPALLRRDEVKIQECA
jgi:hypothetical protein